MSSSPMDPSASDATHISPSNTQSGLGSTQPLRTNSSPSRPSRNDLSSDESDTHAHMHTVFSPLSFFHPTRAEGSLHFSQSKGEDVPVHWGSRESRKRVYQPKNVSVHHEHPTRRHDDDDEGREKGMGRKKEPWSAELRVHQPGQRWPPWDRASEGSRAREVATKLKPSVVMDVSFWVALMFVLGSVAWVVNAFLLYLPLLSPSNTPQASQAAAWAFVGGTLFEIGAYLMLVESLNTGHGQLFGPSVEALIEGKHDPREDGRNDGAKFVWMATRSPRDLGYLASSVQMFAASIFWVSTLTGLPGVIPRFFADPPSPPVAVTDVFFWTPQVIGGTGFVVASLLLMLEVQKSWWRFNFRSLGWHIAVWNLIGATGFLLCGAFGYDSLNESWEEYQSVLSTFWGSWAFLIGSLLQLGETLWRE